MRRALLIAAAAAALAGPALAGEYEDAMLRVTEHMPRDVTAFIYRRVDCNHWQAQDPTDPAVQRHLRSLGCARVDHDERVLRRRYTARPEVIAAINEAFGMQF